MTNEEMQKAIKLVNELKEKYAARAKKDNAQIAGIEEASAILYELLNRRGKKLESHLSHTAKVEEAFIMLMELKRKLRDGQSDVL